MNDATALRLAVHHLIELDHYRLVLRGPARPIDHADRQFAATALRMLRARSYARFWKPTDTLQPRETKP